MRLFRASEQVHAMFYHTNWPTNDVDSLPPLDPSNRWKPAIIQNHHIHMGENIQRKIH